ncbi:MAG: ankyrin repeat protein [Verrucomicrobiales bacterium]|jgi:ankyrin repeat protein
MRLSLLLALGLFIPLTACRDTEETALDHLNERGYGFAVSEFHRAAAIGDLESVRQFLEGGMAVDVEDDELQTAFLRAAAEDQDEMVRMLIDAGAKPDQRLADGQTMLMKVAGRKAEDLHLLDFLLERHADVKASDSAGMTPLTIAALSGNVDVVRRLALRDVRSIDKSLMLSSSQGHTHCMEALIEQGAYVNCRSHDNQTPLMYAAGKGHQEAVQLLLRHHANRFALDDEDMSAADRAEVANQPELAVLLRDTSDLIPPDVPANNEFLPSLDGQLIALFSSSVPLGYPTLDPIEPDRPLLDPVGETTTELPPTAVSASGSSSKETSNVEQPRPAATTSASASTKPVQVDVREEIQLGRFEERFKSVLVTEVIGEKAKVRLLHRPVEQGFVMVIVGERIPDTSYEVTKVTKRMRTAKGGGTVDVSEVLTRDTRRQTEQRFVRGSLPRDEDTHLVVETKRSQERFAARLGDVFTVAETKDQFMVTDIRPHQLLLRNESTGEILTIDRG